MPGFKPHPFYVREMKRYGMTKARDYGVFQLYLDGRKLGQPVDLFSPNVEPADPITFGVRPLGKGMHTLRVEGVGSNSDVKIPHGVGIHLFGLDYLLIRRPSTTERGP